MTRRHPLGFIALVTLLLSIIGCATTPSSMESWSDTEATRAIVAFVDSVSDPASPDFVAPAARIAVFDNDGTLWAERPVYFQLLFAIDRVKAMGPEHPEWSTQEPFRSVLAGDMDAVAKQGEKAIMSLIAATHAGMTTDEFEATVTDWIATARHPTLDRRLVHCVFQPQLELIEYLHANDFKVFIVSGGGIDFMRALSEETYGIERERVVGSSGKVQYELRNGSPVLVKLREIDFIDDKAGKPVGIHKHIGRRPILAVGNSDGDFEMLEWVTAGSGRRLGVLIHHTDAAREFAYDRDSHIGKLARGLDEAPSRGWIVVDMVNDWDRIFPREE